VSGRSLRQPHPAQQVGVARIGADGVPVRIGLDEENLRMRLGGLIQPDERLIFVTKEHIALGCKVRVIIRDRSITGDLNRPAQRPSWPFFL
jgi:hypothetical protein